MLTERGDRVIDPFAGSCVTGEVCERIERRWVCVELSRDYCDAALGRFVRPPHRSERPPTPPDDPSNYYRIPRPGTLWNGDAGPRYPKTVAGNVPARLTNNRAARLSRPRRA